MKWCASQSINNDGYQDQYIEISDSSRLDFRRFLESAAGNQAYDSWSRLVFVNSAKLITGNTCIALKIKFTLFYKFVLARSSYYSNVLYHHIYLIMDSRWLRNVRRIVLFFFFLLSKVFRNVLLNEFLLFSARLATSQPLECQRRACGVSSGAAVMNNRTKDFIGGIWTYC